MPARKYAVVLDVTILKNPNTDVTTIMVACPDSEGCVRSTGVEIKGDPSDQETSRAIANHVRVMAERGIGLLQEKSVAKKRASKPGAPEEAPSQDDL